MKILITTIRVIFLLFDYSFAQAPDTLWTKTFGGLESDWGNSIYQTNDGGYIITGFTTSFGAGMQDVWLIKTDNLGDTLWTRVFGGIDEDVALSIQQTTDEGYIISGWTKSFGYGFSDAWLIKTNELGDTLWTKTFGGIYPDAGYSVQQTSDGGYILTGETHSFGNLLGDVWLIKTDESGDTLWTKTFGGMEWDRGSSVRQTLNGGFIITGLTASFGAGSNDVWLIKTNESGDTLWTKTFGGSSGDGGISVRQTSDGGYIIVGGTDSFGVGGIWLIKTSNLGDTLWTKVFGGIDGDVAASVQQTTDEGYIISGWTESFGAGYSDVWLIKTNESGDSLWTKTIGGSGADYCFSGQQTLDGGYIIEGYTTSFGAGASDVWLIKTTPDVSDVESKTNLILSDFSLQQNYPNPFNPSTTIKFSFPSSGFTILKVYDVLGNEVATLVDEYKPAGTYEIEWNASGLPSGVYFYQLKTNAFIETKKMILMR